MIKTLLKICIGGLAGMGLGLIVSKRKIEQLEAERDTLELSNKSLTSICEFRQMQNDNLRAANELFTDLLLREKED